MDFQGVVSYIDEVLTRHPRRGVCSKIVLKFGALIPAGLTVICVEGVVQYYLQTASLVDICPGHPGLTGNRI